MGYVDTLLKREQTNVAATVRTLQITFDSLTSQLSAIEKQLSQSKSNLEELNQFFFSKEVVPNGNESTSISTTATTASTTTTNSSTGSTAESAIVTSPAEVNDGSTITASTEPASESASDPK